MSVDQIFDLADGEPGLEELLDRGDSVLAGKPSVRFGRKIRHVSSCLREIQEESVISA